MSSAAKKILEEALALSEDDRLRLAERLLDSVPRASAEEIAHAWDAEVMRRIEASERGETAARDWDEVVRELRAKYTRK